VHSQRHLDHGSDGDMAVTKRKPLEWYEVAPGKFAPGCDTCFEFLCRPLMAEAIASVGIEHGGIDIRGLLDRYHANRHSEV
jgi:hypothetical protein